MPTVEDVRHALGRVRAGAHDEDLIDDFVRWLDTHHEELEAAALAELGETGAQPAAASPASFAAAPAPARPRPTTLAELVHVVRAAEAQGQRVRAVGAGRSFSDAARSDGLVVDTRGLAKVDTAGAGALPLRRAELKGGFDPRYLVQAEAGVVVRALNEQLHAKALGLENMGAFDGQTLLGAISTGTHGSGFHLGALSACVRSLVLVSGGGEVHHIEPANGVTDPARFTGRWNGHPIRLHADDDLFRAAVVGVGSLGVVYAATLKVVDHYQLLEKRELADWDDVRADLLAGGAQRHRHFEVLVNPYLRRGRRRCLVTRRDALVQPMEPRGGLAHRPFFSQLALRVRLAGEVLVRFVNTFAGLVPALIDSALDSLSDKNDYVDWSHNVLVFGASAQEAVAAEYGFPHDTYLDAVDRIFAIADDERRAGRAFHSSPIALRFVRPEAPFLSMQRGVPTVMVEMPLLEGTRGAVPLLQRYERELCAEPFRGRPHWGELNWIDGAGVRALYGQDEVDRFVGARRALDPRGTFDGPFTRRCAL